MLCSRAGEGGVKWRFLWVVDVRLVPMTSTPTLLDREMYTEAHAARLLGFRQERCTTGLRAGPARKDLSAGHS